MLAVTVTKTMFTIQVDDADTDNDVTMYCVITNWAQITSVVINIQILFKYY